MALGLYEKAETRMIRTYLRDERYVIELGSSVGYTAAHLLDVMDPAGHLVCVEANPNLIPTLRRLVEEHRGPNQRVDVVHAAIADGPVTLDIRTSTGSRIGSDGLVVPWMTLDDLLTKIGWEHYAMMCDIEGGETSFVFGDSSALESCSRLVVELDDTEYDGRAIRADDTYDALIESGFRSEAQHAAVVALVR